MLPALQLALIDMNQLQFVELQTKGALGCTEQGKGWPDREPTASGAP